MDRSTTISVVLGTLAFTLVTFIVQASSHFVINAEHFASVSFIREEPIMALGLITMILQGAILSYLFSRLKQNGNSLAMATGFGLLMGVFLVSYIALVEPSKYTVPSIGQWAVVEGMAGLIQFSLFGLCLGLIHKFVAGATAKS